MMHEGYTQATPGLHPVYIRVTRGLHPGYARGTPELHSSLNLFTPGYAVPNPIKNVVLRYTINASGVRWGCGSTRAIHQHHAEVTFKSHVGGTQVTPWLRPIHALVTLELHPPHHGQNPGYAEVKHKLRPGYTSR